MPDLKPNFEYVGSWRCGLALWIDGLFLLPLSWALFTPLRLYSFNHRMVLPIAAWDLGLLIVIVTLLTQFGGTPGKLLLGLRVVDDSGRFLEPRLALVRLGPGMLTAMLILMAEQLTYSALPREIRAATLKELSRIVGAHRQLGSQALYLLSSGIFLLDILLINRGDLQQTGHDRLAGSFVVTRASLLAAEADLGFRG